MFLLKNDCLSVLLRTITSAHIRVEEFELKHKKECFLFIIRNQEDCRLLTVPRHLTRGGTFACLFVVESVFLQLC